MTNKEVDRLIKEAVAVIAEAFDQAAAIALMAVENGAKLQTFCKEVTAEAGMPDAWNALRNRAQKLQKARSEGAADRAARRSPSTRRIRYEMDQAGPEAKRQAIAEALENDPEVFGNKEVLNAAARAVSASLGAPPVHSERTKQAKETANQVAVLSYLVSAASSLTRAKESTEELTEEQHYAASRLMSDIAGLVAELSARYSQYDLS
jgi:hypothetical protein